MINQDIFSYKILKQSDFLRKSQVVLIYLYAFSLPFYLEVSTKIIILLVAVSLFIRPLNAYKRISYLVFPILYLLTLVAILRIESIDWSYLENRALFIAIPLIFLTLKLSKKEIENTFKWFVIGCLAAIVVCDVVALYHSMTIENGAFHFESATSSDLNFFHSVGGDNNYFFSGRFSLFHQISFFALYLNVCLVIVLIMGLWKSNKVRILLVLLFSITIFQLSNRAGFLTLAVLLFYYTIRKVKSIWLKTAISILLVFATTVTIYLNPRGEVMLKELWEKGLTIDPSETNSYGLRLMSWDASLHLIAESPILGIGLSPQNRLNEVYKEKKYKKPLLEQFNSHNQFLQTHLEYGAFGLVLLLYFLYQIGFKKTNNIPLNLFKEYLLIIIGIGFFFDSLITRYAGISFVVFFYYLLDYAIYSLSPKNLNYKSVAEE